jgi:hypothetical protein|tara:strand:+ start:257 stop:478 length:222 start_codon:yes stop_codon:yes gene_type:complete
MVFLFWSNKMSEIKIGKIIIDFPDSHKDVAEGLADRIVEELENHKDKPKDYEDDEYADKGMSRDDFIDKEYTQ